MLRNFRLYLCRILDLFRSLSVWSLTITKLSDGAALTAAGMGRAGYGFDALANQGGGNFYGQKGGSLASSGNVLEFNSQWDIALCWGGKATAATRVGTPIIRR